ncbi:hypothetical protein kuro4_04040 [Gelria sp. Kuro-4]|nr:hypothetical protein kuro4_04040 [Gelria sp. Kuro-4]
MELIQQLAAAFLQVFDRICDLGGQIGVRDLRNAFGTSSWGWDRTLSKSPWKNRTSIS